ncbi:MAG: hypothetical protein OEY59_00210 [Deltaproteobacteria bacterium]|nr:hypothetical protein [Deltaproteobacteria bacterium]
MPNSLSAKRLFLLILFLISCGYTSNVIAQQNIFSDYTVKQLSSGMSNYGYIQSVYYQYTGNPIFEASNPPKGVFSNMNWLNIHEVNLYLPKGFGYGFEYMRFYSSSQSTYLGKDNVIGPDINMQVDFWSFTVRGFFQSPMKEPLQPYFGAGWGVMSGVFDTIKVDGSEHQNRFQGLINYRSIGTQLMFSEIVGISVEIRSLTSNKVRVSGDPFGVAEIDSDLFLDFSGSMLNLFGFIRF